MLIESTLKPCKSRHKGNLIFLKTVIVEEMDEEMSKDGRWISFRKKYLDLGRCYHLEGVPRGG